MAAYTFHLQNFSICSFIGLHKRTSYSDVMLYDSSFNNIQPLWPLVTQTRWSHNQYFLMGARIRVVWFAFCCW